MTFMPYLHFDGTCAEAMAFYAGVFGGTDLQVMRYSEAPPDSQMPPSDRIMHSQFATRDGILMASDYPPGRGLPQQAVSVMVAPATVAEALSIYEQLMAGGACIMPFGPTFWSAGFGMLKDRFGTHWIIGAQPEPVA